MREMEISVVVPVYQVEKYIKDTIESLCQQTFKDFEVILVDDGSKDNSIKIAENILLKNNINFRIVKQKNMGVSAARNKGILAAKGNWIVCIDSDDILNKNFLYYLYSGIKDTNYVVSIVNYQYVKKENLYLLPSKIFEKSKLIGEEKIDLFMKRKLRIISPAILINKKFLLENNLFYEEKSKFSEDVLYIYTLLFKVDVIVYNETPLYNYYIRPNSTMTSSNGEKILTGYQEFLKFSKKVKNEQIMARWILGVTHSSAKLMEYSEYKKFLEKLNYKKYLKELLIFPDIKVKILCSILKINLFLYYIIMKKI